MAQAFADGAQPFDRGVDFVGFFEKAIAVELGRPVFSKHGTDLVKGEARHLPKRDEGQPVQHGGSELTALALAAMRTDQSLLFIEAQRGGGQACIFADVGDIHVRTCAQVNLSH